MGRLEVSCPFARAWIESTLALGLGVLAFRKPGGQYSFLAERGRDGPAIRGEYEYVGMLYQAVCFSFVGEAADQAKVDAARPVARAVTGEAG